MINIEYFNKNIKTVSNAEQENVLPFEMVKIKTEQDCINDNPVQHSVDSNLKEELQENEPPHIDIKTEPSTISHLIHCCSCKQEFQGSCPNCPSISHILNNARPRTKNRLKASIPKNILEITNPPFREPGVFALRTIPKGAIFGPYEGLEPSILSTNRSAWKMAGEKLKTIEELEYLNWMSCVNSTEDPQMRNLFAFQHDGRLYYQSDRQIDVGNELLIHYDRDRIDLDGVDQYYCPVGVKKMGKIFSCVPCCLGFSTEDDLLKHDNGCTCEKIKTEGFEENRQSSLCKVPFDAKDLDSHKYSMRVTDSLNVYAITRPFSCYLCGKKFTAVSNLYKHTKNHVNTKHKLTQHPKFFKDGLKKRKRFPFKV